MPKKKPDFVLDIEKNALSSLSHGIEHFVEDDDDNDNLKFAIIHVFHALELFLKARLAKAHPLLIYSKPECAITDDAHTVGYDLAIGRLRNIGVEFSEDDIKDLDALRKRRNSIEHHRIHANKEECKNYIGRASRFLDNFLKVQLNMSLKDSITEDAYKTLEEAIYSYEERVEKAKEEMLELLPSDKERYIDNHTEICPMCGEETILVPDPTLDHETVHCFFCGEKFYYEECTECGRATFSSNPISEDEYNPFCDECWDHKMSKD